MYVHIYTKAAAKHDATTTLCDVASKAAQVHHYWRYIYATIHNLQKQLQQDATATSCDVAFEQHRCTHFDHIMYLYNNSQHKQTTATHSTCNKM